MMIEEETKEVIETSAGKLWVARCDDGKLRVWWPSNSPAGELAMTVLQGRAYWYPVTGGWYVPAGSRDEIYEKLLEL